MDRFELAAAISQAERAVELGAQQVARQRALIARLESSGRTAVSARQILEVHEESQKLRIATRDMLKRKLDNLL